MEKTSKENPIFIIITALIALALIVVFAMSFVSASEGKFQHEYVDFSEGWTDDSGKEVNLDALGESIRIYKTIPDIANDSVLSFNARNVDVNVYIDDTEVYSVRKTDNNFLKAMYGKTSGSDFVEISVMREDSGKTFCIDVNNPYKNGNSCRIVDMFLGNGAQIIKHDVSV